MSWLLPIYISTGIFGLGVILIDMFGILGHGHHDGSSDSDDSIDHDFDHSSDHDTDHSGNNDSGYSEYQDGSQEHYSVIAHDNIKSVSLIFQLLFILRCFVYFSIGFGLVGFILTVFSKMNSASLLFSMPTGIVTMTGAIMLRRLQRTNLDSQVTMKELETSNAEILVSVKKGQIGKARILYKGIYVDRYVKAIDNNKEFKTGDKVQVVKVEDDILYIS